MKISRTHGKHRRMRFDVRLCTSMALLPMSIMMIRGWTRGRQLQHLVCQAFVAPASTSMRTGRCIRNAFVHDSGFAMRSLQSVRRISTHLLQSSRCHRTSLPLVRAPMMMCLSSTSSSSSFDADKVTSLQRQLGDKAKSFPRTQNDQESLASSSSSFVDHQRQVFDGMAQWFASDEAVPDDLHPPYEYLATRIIQAFCCSDDEIAANDDARRTIRLLDVGTGTGALIPFYQKAIEAAAVDRDVVLRITGVDLSPNMIAEAKQKYGHLMAEANQDKPKTRTVIDDLVVSNVLDYQVADDDSKYDAIVMNSCFGNFLDPRAVMGHLSTRLLRSVPTSLVEAGSPEPTRAGRAFVTHPLGADFVQMLHEECPDTVPHPLPTRREWQSDLLLGLPLVLARWETQSGSSEQPFYYAEIESVRYRTLPNVMRMRGTVASGFGRGGKKLGFPTANLGPSLVFEKALESVETGVYFGWATIESNDAPVVHKAVVNVGYSPTFQEQNPVKIVEAHLILDESAQSALGDFYNRTMRLQLIGYLRPEIKFPSFPALIAQITADRDDASRALDQAPYSYFRNDGFLRGDDSSWTGSTGGDSSASWEFTPLRSTLETLLDEIVE